MKERKEITMKELETFMAAKKSVFEATSEDRYSMSLNILGTGVEFGKDCDGEYMYIVLLSKSAEIQIEVDIVEAVYMETGGSIIIEFSENLPGLEIQYKS